MKISKYLILCSILFSATLFAQGKPTVAILDFEGEGVDAGDVKTLTERMRTEIGNTNAVRLIERKAVEKIMEEQGFQQSGCTSDECAAEVGQLLGVQFMVSGSIGKMGKKYTIDCKMFSVETGETVRAKNATFEVFWTATRDADYGVGDYGLDAAEAETKKSWIGGDKNRCCTRF